MPMRSLELGFAHADMVDVGLANLVQGVAGGHQHLFRRAAAIWAGAAEVALLDHRHLHPGLSRRHGDAEACIAAAQDQHIVAIGCHELVCTPDAPLPPMPEIYGCDSRRQETWGRRPRSFRVLM